MDDECWPDEQDYVEALAHERHLFAWTLVRYGGYPPLTAKAHAENAYPFEPRGTEGRGLVFHDEAWHWAMIMIHGTCYWHDRPELVTASPEYRREAEQYDSSS